MPLLPRHHSPPRKRPLLIPSLPSLPFPPQDANLAEVPSGTAYHWGWERKKEALGKIEINTDREKTGIGGF